MQGRAHLLLPLASSMIYVLGALWVRRSADLGVGVWRATFVANALSALFFSPLLLLGGPGQPLSLLWQPSRSPLCSSRASSLASSRSPAATSRSRLRCWG